MNDKARSLWITKELSGPFNKMNSLVQAFNQILNNNQGALSSSVDIEQALQLAKEQTGIKSYLQYSAHDIDVANWWQFLNRQRKWYHIPFASFIHMHLSYDETCVIQKNDEKKYHKTSQKTKISSFGDVGNFQECFYVSMGTNGKPLLVDWNRGGDIILNAMAPGSVINGQYNQFKWAAFQEQMFSNSYNMEGFESHIVNKNCDQGYDPTEAQMGGNIVFKTH